jgi:transketolase
VVLDGEVGNSTHTEEAGRGARALFQLYIAEQCMVGVQTGLQALGKTAFAATFGAFLTRAADQDPDGRDRRADLRLCGSHAGVSIGEDGRHRWPSRICRSSARSTAPPSCTRPTG